MSMSYRMLGFKKKLNYFQSKQGFLSWFFNQPEHQWIKLDKFTQANLLDFFETFPLKFLNTIYETQDVILYPSSGKFACSVQKSHKSVILIFPELRSLMNAPCDGWAKAVLGHEYGHLFHKHGSRMIDPLEAQIEADRFSIGLGHIEELSQFLEEQVESIEKRTRLSYLTSLYFQDH